MVDLELISQVFDLYLLIVEQVVVMECMGEKFVQNLINVLEVSKYMMLF